MEVVESEVVRSDDLVVRNWPLVALRGVAAVWRDPRPVRAASPRMAGAAPEVRENRA